MRKCTVEGCERKYLAKGLCKNHYDSLYQKNNHEKYLESQREQSRKNSKARVQKTKEWRKNNPEKVKIHLETQRLKREAQIKLATPPWADLKAIRRIYSQCPPGYDVDHVLPLISKDVCGLHLPWNLQYLTKEENRRKQNKFDPHPPVEIKKEAA